MAKHLDFDAAQNAAFSCIESARAFQLNLVSQWNSCQRKSTDDALTSFQREAAKLFATLVDIYMQAENAMAKEVLVSLAKAGCNTNIPVARVNGRTFETWHEAAIELLYKLVAVPVVVSPMCDEARSRKDKRVVYTALGSLSELWKPEQAQQLRAALAAFDGDKKAFWGRVVGKVRNYRIKNIEDMKAHVLSEWKAVMAYGQPGQKANRRCNASHSPDFTEVTWHDERYLFTPTQARAVEILWNGWETGGATITGKYIIKSLDLGASRTLPQVFRLRTGEYHKAWGSLIIPAKGIKGAYCLNDPDDPALQVAAEEEAKRSSPRKPKHTGTRIPKRTGTRKK
jgi:hypothetical protein